MLKYASKFALDMLPSVIATVVGAYIVNHYINAKPANPPIAAAISTGSTPSGAAVPSDGAAKVAAKTTAETSESSLDGATNSKPAAPANTTEKVTTEKAIAEKSAETAANPADSRRHKPVQREKEKAVAKVAPVISAPVISAPVAVQPVETTSDERRDANEMARAAIERLRRSNDVSVPPQETPRVAVTSASPMQPLPPAISVANPSRETFDRDGEATASLQPKPGYFPVSRVGDSRRPTPPGEIPASSRPLDLRADSTDAAPAGRSSVAEDVLSAAKSVFHSVMPR